MAWGRDFVAVDSFSEDVLFIFFEEGVLVVDEGDAGAVAAGFVEFVVLFFVFGEAVWVDADDRFKVVLFEFSDGGEEVFVPVLVEEGVGVDLKKVVFVLHKGLGNEAGPTCAA